ncbi:MAG: hypothetical protein ACQXXF_07065 [Thermoplasmatota archaeon]
MVKADPIWFFFPPIINNTVGEIHGAAVAVFGYNVSTPIDCFNITFTAQNTPGTSLLTLHDVIITNPNGQQIYPVINNGQVTIVGTVNHPPVFGTPSPANGSTGQPLSFTWSIPISDLEGDLFDWSIQCSNGQSNSGSGSGNGTKSLSLSGLSYLTTYIVWVNATDPVGSGQYTRAWYTFTTKQFENQPSNTPGNPNPGNGAVNVNVNTILSWSCSDPDGDPLTFDVYFGTDYPPALVSSNQTNKTYNPGKMNFSTHYYWRIIAWDNHNASTSAPIWDFTTSANTPPKTPSAPSGPTSGKQGVVYEYTAVTTDSDNDRIYYQFDWGDGSNSGWIGPYNSGEQASASHSWVKGTYSVRVKAKDSNNAESGWSDPITVKIPRTMDVKPQILNRIIQVL